MTVSSKKVDENASKSQTGSYRRERPDAIDGNRLTTFYGGVKVALGSAFDVVKCRLWGDAVEKWPNVIGFPIGERFGLRVILVLMGVTAGPANDRSADAI